MAVPEFLLTGFLPSCPFFFPTSPQGDSVSKLPKGPSENGELSAPLELGSLVNGVS